MRTNNSQSHIESLCDPFLVGEIWVSVAQTSQTRQGMSTSKVALSLYRQILKQANKFSSYNYREYTLRRTKDAFRANRNIKDLKETEKLLEEGRKNLDVIQRQALINNLYHSQKLVIENPQFKGQRS